ncbi:hypothetical protein [Pseudomonas syringae]|uniref:hypothetical protein n=1 Tax=Pseudomonas syringae TaxID=317 RepID=UPI0012FE6299|nr:hypothetical protein [Pseudomonas syringae]
MDKLLVSFWFAVLVVNVLCSVVDVHPLGRGATLITAAVASGIFMRGLLDILRPPISVESSSTGKKISETSTPT